MYSISTKDRTDEKAPKKERETNQRITTRNSQLAVGDIAPGQQNINSGADSTKNFPQPAPMMQQPKVDTTDRRQIEDQNEDKSRTTKETLDDIKRCHYKEKKKKEQNQMEQCPLQVSKSLF